MTAVLLFAAACAGESSDTFDELKGGGGSGGDGGSFRGAIFTTTVDGSRVNANIYGAKGDVYLDGGPGEKAPSSAAALPAGSYVFQVTDPSGKHVLSLDDISCRSFHINGSGVIDAVTGGACSHATGLDRDHGGLTVQLMPYADTPNHGGEYKVWVTSALNKTFKPAKTDNFKIREEEGSGSGSDCDAGVPVS